MASRPGFWWVYILEREDSSWYTGISTDPRRRLEEHRSGKGAKAMQVSPASRLVCLEAVGPYPHALRREAQIKGLSKASKRLYAADPGSLAPPPQGADWLHRAPKRSASGPERVY